MCILADLPGHSILVLVWSFKNCLIYHLFLQVLVGPMGSGKKQLALRLAAEYPYIFGYVPSHTTRAIYPHEERNREYVFCSEKEWETQFSAGMFIEHYRGLVSNLIHGANYNY